MGPVNWLAVVLAAALALALGMVWPGGKGRGHIVTAAIVLLLGAAMLGHAYARIGPDTLAIKPWLYPMQSGGIALFFIAPTLWLANERAGADVRSRFIDCGYWIVAYLVMGAVFWVLG